jgi:hypothetical protein
MVASRQGLPDHQGTTCTVLCTLNLVLMLIGCMHADTCDQLGCAPQGFYGRAKNCYRVAVRRGQRAMQYMYRDRRTRKRDMRTVRCVLGEAVGRAERFISCVD